MKHGGIATEETYGQYLAQVGREKLIFCLCVYVDVHITDISDYVVMPLCLQVYVGSVNQALLKEKAAARAENQSGLIFCFTVEVRFEGRKRNPLSPGYRGSLKMTL